MKKIIVVAILSTLSLSGCWDVGSGDHVGQVIKMNKQGMFCKTWEVEIIKGGLTSGSGASGGRFDFTVPEGRTDIIDVLKQAMNTGEEVLVHYSMESASFCRSDSHSVFANSVQVETSAVNTNRETVSVSATEQNSTDNQTVKQLLEVQAELIKKLSEKTK